MATQLLLVSLVTEHLQGYEITECEIEQWADLQQ
jgi:hypothetical protein